MAINTTYTREERILLDNIDRARAAGIDIGGECEALYFAIIGGIGYTSHNGNAVGVDDRRVSFANDHLFNRAVDQGKQNDVKWVGQVK